MTAVQAINDVLANADASTLPDQIKETVAREISEIDGSVEVRKTDYFNHSFVPDLVAWWGPSENDHRPIFLRFDATDPFVALDVERLDRNSPMFFSLRSHQVDETPPELAERLSEHPAVMVTDGAGVDALSGAAVDSFESLITGAIVRAGRGVVDERVASAARSSTSAGVEAALMGDELRTSQAVQTARRLLREHAAQRIEKYLGLLWAAGGSAPSAYPGSQEVALDVGAEDLPGLIRLILKDQGEKTDEYWRRLGGALELGSLESLGSIEPSSSFDRLVSVNADRLLVSYAHTRHEVSRRLRDDGSPELRWSVAGSSLILEGPEWSIEYSADGRHFKSVPRDRPLPGLTEFTRRANRFRVESMKLDDEHAAITVEPKDPDGDTGSAVRDIAERLSGLTGVRRAVVRNGGSISVEFDRLVTAAKEQRIGLRALTEVAVSLTAKAADAEREELVASLANLFAATSFRNDVASPASAREDPALF